VFLAKKHLTYVHPLVLKVVTLLDAMSCVF